MMHRVICLKVIKYDYGNHKLDNTTGTETICQNYLTPSYFGNVVVDITRCRYCKLARTLGA